MWALWDSCDARAECADACHRSAKIERQQPLRWTPSNRTPAPVNMAHEDPLGSSLEPSGLRWTTLGRLRDPVGTSRDVAQSTRRMKAQGRIGWLDSETRSITTDSIADQDPEAEWRSGALRGHCDVPRAQAHGRSRWQREQSGAATARGDGPEPDHFGGRVRRVRIWKVKPHGDEARNQGRSPSESGGGNRGNELSGRTATRSILYRTGTETRRGCDGGKTFGG